MAPKLYWREFIRKGQPDKDNEANEADLDTKFKDFFGKWLQQGDNASCQSFDSLVMHFWSKFLPSHAL